MGFSNVKLPFSVTDLISSGSGLLGIVGAFVLLGLAFYFVPMLEQIIKSTIGYYNYYTGTTEERWYNNEKPTKKEALKMALYKGIDNRHERWYR